MALRSGGSWLLCGLKHPGRELSPGRTRECATPRRSSRRKTGRTAEKTPCTRRVLFGRVRAPLPDSDVRSLPRHTRATVQYFDFCQGFRSVAMFGVYIFITIAMWRCVAFYLLHSRFRVSAPGPRAAGDGGRAPCRASRVYCGGLAVGMGACEDGVRRRVVVCSARRPVGLGAQSSLAIPLACSFGGANGPKTFRGLARARPYRRSPLAEALLRPVKLPTLQALV